MPSDPTPDARVEARFLQILDTAPDAMVVVDAQSRMVYVNRQTETLFGYTRAELLGQRLELLIPSRFRDAHAGHVAKFFSQPTIRPMGSALALFGRRADGREIAIEVSLGPVQTDDGVMVSAAIRDITERRRMEVETKLASDRLASAVESIQDAFALFDAEDKLVLCNSQYRSLLATRIRGPLVGLPYKELLEGWLEELSFSDDAARARFLRERIAARREATSTFEVRTLDGRNLRVIDRRTAEGGVVKTIWDLTDDVRREHELSEARTAAEAGSAAKSDFLASMSHELRTPLNAILGFAQLLQRDRKEPLSERHKERVGQILKGGEHLLRLIDDILDLSRIEAGAVSISTEAVEVTAVLAEVRTTLESMAVRAGVQIALEPPPASLPMVAADRTRFAQILMNFGSNALKYNRAGGHVTFAASAPSATHVRVAVTDTGLGIAPEQQPKLFQPFQRAGQETGPIEGTGIGLVITKRLAEIMNGTVGFSSKPGEGSTFWVELPVHRAEPAEAVVLRATRDGGATLDGDQQRLVLYVEDNPANVTFMRDLLSAFERIELVTTSTAEQGLEVARARHPSVILMDINLPGMSGLDALRALRAAPETRDIPVIALTAAASARDKERGEQAGFFRYLTKPIHVDDLERALEQVFEPVAH